MLKLVPGHWGLVSPNADTVRFTEHNDLAKFLDIAKEVGVLVVLRPGPYINAESAGGEKRYVGIIEVWSNISCRWYPQLDDEYPGPGADQCNRLSGCLVSLVGVDLRVNFFLTHSLVYSISEFASIAAPYQVRQKGQTDSHHTHIDLLVS